MSAVAAAVGSTGVAVPALAAPAGYSTAVVNDAPTVYYRLDEPSGTTAADSSGHSNAGTYGVNGSGGGITYSVPGALTDAADSADTAVSFDGSVPQPVTGPAGMAVPTGDSPWTMAGWYSSTSSQPQVVESFGQGSQEQEAGLAVWPATGGQNGYRLAIDFNGQWAQWPNQHLNDGRWHYLVVSYGGGGNSNNPKLSAYVDGGQLGAPLLDGSNNSAFVFPLNIQAGPFRVGYWSDTSYEKPLTGSVDEVALYPTAVGDVASQYSASGGATHPGQAKTVTVSLSPAAIAAGDATMATATATVRDVNGNPLVNEPVTFSTSDPNVAGAGTVTNNHDGTYSVQLAPSKQAGSVTVTATDSATSPPTAGTAVLNQTWGPAANVSLALQPAAVPADGQATSTAIAAVTDANNNPVGTVAAPDAVTFTSSDLPGTTVTGTAVGNGLYRATIPASSTVGMATITATDTTQSVSATAVLNRYPFAVAAGACTDSWTNAAGGDWNTASNWSTNAVPGASDVACLPQSIGGSATSYKVTITGATASVTGIQVGANTASTTTQELDLVGVGCGSVATLNLAQDSTVGVTGKIDLTSGGCAGSDDHLVIAAPHTLSSAGVLQSDVSTGGGRYIQGNVVSSGTTQLNISTTFNQAGSTFINEGPLNLANNVQLALPANGAGPASGTTFVAAGGTIATTGNGNLFVDAGNTFVQGAGALAYGSNYPVVQGGNGANPSQLSMTGSGATTIGLRGSISLSGDVAGGQTLLLQGFGCGPVNTVRAAGSFTNSGTMEFTNVGCAGSDASLTLPSGALLTNGSGGRIQTDGGGARTIAASIFNRGVVQINVNTSYNQPSSTFDNQGLLTLNNAQLATPVNGNGPAAAITINDDKGGQIGTGGGGYLLVDGGNAYVQGAGTLASASNPPVVQGNGTNNSQLRFTGAGAATVMTRAGVTLSGNVAAGQTVIEQGWGCGPTATLTVAGNVTNSGTIDLTNAGCGGNDATLAVPSGASFTNASSGLVQTDGGGYRYIVGSLTNQGTIQANINTTYNQPGSTFDNQGTLSIAGGAQFAIPFNTSGNPVTFDNDTGLMATAGTGNFFMDGGNVFQQGNGKLAAGANPPVVQGQAGGNDVGHEQSRILFTGTGSPMTIATHYNVGLAGDIAAGQTLDMQAVGCGGQNWDVADTGFKNFGTIDMSAVGCGSDWDYFVVDGGGTLANQPGGVVQVDSGTGGNRYLWANITNQGTVVLNNGLYLNGPGATFDNQGALNINNGAQFNIPLNSAGALSQVTFTNDSNGAITTAGNGNFFMDGGNRFIQGAGSLTNGSLPLVVQGNGANNTQLTFNGTGATNIDLRYGITMSGDIAAGQIIDMQGVGCGGPNTVTAAAGFQNAGTIQMSSVGCGFDNSVLALPANAVLTNTQTGVIEGMAGGSHTISGGVLTNQGTVAADPGYALNLANAPTNNSGTTLTGGTWVANGTITWPGAAVQTDSASITLGGASIRNSTNNTDALSGLSEISPGALLAYAGSGTYQLPTTALNNDGTLALDPSNLNGGGLQVGSYTQSATGTLSTGVGPSGAGELFVPAGGTANIGTAVISYTSAPGFAPPQGAVFPVISAPTITGTATAAPASYQPNQPAYSVKSSANEIDLVAAQATTSHLAASPGTSITFGSPVTLSDTVTPVVGTGIPSGSVTFTDTFGKNAPGTLCTATLPAASGPAAQCTVTQSALTRFLDAGSHLITASYSDPSLAYGGSSDQVTVTVAPVATMVSIGAPTPAAFGAPALTATVTAASGSGLLGGSVTFLKSTDGGKTWSAIADCAPAVPVGQTSSAGTPSTGTVTCTAKTLNVGTYQVEAAYNADKADPNTLPSTSTPAPLQVTGEQATVTIVTSADPAAAGKAVTFTATATVNNAAPPGGSFSFFLTQAGTTAQTPVTGCQNTPIDVNGKATCQTSSLPVGVEIVDAVFTSDPNAPNYLSGTNGVTEHVGPTTTTLGATADPSMAGANVTFTAQVASPVDAAAGAPAPGGTVTFTSVPAAGGKATTLCNGPVAMASAQAACTTPFATPGTYTVTASYSGDAGNAPSSTTWIQTVAAVPTTTKVTSATQPSQVNAPVTFTATALDTHGNPVTEGQFVFSTIPSSGVTSASCAPVTLGGASAGQGSCTLTFTQAGVYTVTASYTDASGVLAPSNGSVGQGVGVPGTTTSVTETDNTQPNAATGVANTGDSLTFTALVTQPGGANAPTGTVDFKATDQNGSTTVLCGGVALSSGSAACNATAPAASAYAVTASYSGDGADAPSLAWEAMTVNPAGTQNQASTSTAVTVTPNPSGVGSPVTVTASVTGASPTGPLTFVETPVGGNPAVIAGCPTALPSGKTSASCQYTPQSSGTYTFSVSYGGDANNAPSSGALGHTVSGNATTTSVTSAASSANPGSPVAFTATVVWAGQAVTSGTVSFAVTPATGTTVPVSCSGAALSATGTASCSVTFATAGTYTVTATYTDPSATYAGSAGSVGQTIGQPATATTITSASPASSPGSAVTFTATVTSTGNPLTTGAVTFSVTPSGASVPASCTSEALSATGTATCSVTFPTAGTYTVSASYADPSGTYGSSSSSLGEGVGKTPTTTAVSSGTPSSTPGAPVTFTATVTSGTSPLTTGAVTFSVTPAGASVPASCTGAALSATGTATCSVTFPTAGTYTVTASYADASGTYAKSSSSVGQGVGATPTTTTVTSANSSSAPGAPVTFTATVKSGANPVSAGAVTFTVTPTTGVTTPATCAGEALSATGTAACSITFANAGTYTVTASYADSSNTNAPSSGSVGQGVGETATTTKLASSNPSSTSGSAVTFTSTVTSGTNPVSAGAVTFTVTPTTGVTTPATCAGEALSATGTAACSITFANAGTYTVTASYADSSNTNAPSSDSIGQGVGANQSKVGLTYSPAGNPTVGQQVTFTVTVSGTAGSVDFVDQAVGQSNVTICQGVSVANGQAECTTSGLPAGSNAVTAYYSGDSSDATSTATVPLTVTTAGSYPGACTGVTLTAAQAAITQGATDQLTAATTGCNPAQYAFLAYNGTWQIVQDWSQTNTYNVPTTLAPSAQPYYYAVWVKATSAPTGDTFYDTYAVQTVTVNAAPTCTGVLSTPTASVQQPNTATISVGSLGTGCSSPQFQFHMWSPVTQSWSTVQDWSTATTYTFTTSDKSPTGEYPYFLYVLARNGSSVNTSTLFDRFGYDVTEAVVPPAACTNVPGITLSGANVQQPGGGAYLAQIGTTVTVSATAPSGCTGPFQYEYSVYRLVPNGTTPIWKWFYYDPIHNTYGDETTTQPVDTTITSFNWSTTSELASAYNYVWQVKVQYDNFARSTQINLVSSAPCTGSPTLTPVDNGNGTITVTATGVSGCPSPQYYFWTTNATYGSTPPANHDGAWVAAYPNQPDTGWTYGSPSTYSSNNSFTYTKPAGTSAPYTFVVWVREQGASGGYQVWAESPGVS